MQPDELQEITLGCRWVDYFGKLSGIWRASRQMTMFTEQITSQYKQLRLFFFFLTEVWDWWWWGRWTTSSVCGGGSGGTGRDSGLTERLGRGKITRKRMVWAWETAGVPWRGRGSEQNGWDVIISTACSVFSSFLHLSGGSTWCRSFCETKRNGH